MWPLGDGVSQVLVKNKKGLDGPLENCNLRIRLSGCFQSCPSALSSQRSKAKINIVNYFCLCA